MLEEALPIAIGVGAALLPAMAFGGLAAARAFIYLGAGEQAKLVACLVCCPAVAAAVEACLWWQQQQQTCDTAGGFSGSNSSIGSSSDSSMVYV
jgi:hypothetical protein